MKSDIIIHCTLHYNHYVSPSVRLLVKMFRSFEPHGIFDQICIHVHVNIPYWNANPHIFDNYEFVEQLFSLLWSVSKNPHNS